MKRFAVFLLTASLIAGIVGCAEAAPVLYNLTISSTVGGSVMAPAEWVSIYEQGTVVSLFASPDSGYQFVNWTGDVATITDINAALTTITMTDNYLITASFEEIPPPQFNLTISSTAGGSVTAPGEGVSTYDEGTVVSLVASPSGGYRFFKWIGDVDTVADINSAMTTMTVSADYSITASFVAEVDPMVAAGAAHTVGLRADSRVLAVGRNTYGQCDVGGWSSIVQIAAGGDHTLGLKSDGTVVAVGRNDYGQCNVGTWSGITQVAGGGLHTVALKSDGTVIAVGQNNNGQCNVGSWTEIVQVAAGAAHTMGLKADGTVVAVGHNTYGQCDVGGWTDIIQVAAGAYHTLGLRSNHTVVAVGWDISRQLQVGEWKDVVQVAGGIEHSLGLSSDGNLVRCVGWKSPGQCDFSGWTDITQIAAGALHTVGLKSDGTVLAVGQHDEGQCEVGGWTLN